MEDPAPSAPAKPLLSNLAYRRLRRGILLVFWGLIYFRLLALVPYMLGVPRDVHALIDAGSYALILAGLGTLLAVSRERGYRFLLAWAMAGAFASGAAEVAANYQAIPKPVRAGFEVMTSLAAWAFAFALRRLLERTEWWPRVVQRIRKDTYLIGACWVGTDAFVVTVMLVPFSVGPREIIGLLLLTIIRIVPFVHLWRTMNEIVRNAVVRHNVRVVARRRKAPKPLPDP